MNEHNPDISITTIQSTNMTKRKINMYTRKFSRSKSLRRPLTVLLLSLFLLSGLVATQAPNLALGMRREDPTETDPIGVGNDPPTYTPPAGGFSWSMEKRFGPDLNGDGLVDYHWDPVTMTYDPAYVYPTSWKISFNGCRTANDHSNSTLPSAYDYDYSWTLDGAILSTVSCKPTRIFTDKSPHTMGLTVTKVSDDSIQTYPNQAVQVKDYFIVSIGDSYASGQGNPDIEQEVISGPLGIGWVLQSEAQWEDLRCMRSAKAAPALAALALEASDPHSSVTFISFACTGATIQTPSWDFHLGADNTPLWDLRGSGILGIQRGEITDVPYGDYDHYIKPQMQQVEEALAASNGQTPRQIDALLISGGGNDMKFGPLLNQCVLFTNCWVNDFAQMKEDPVNDSISYDLADIVVRAVGEWQGANGPDYTVPGNYAALGARINLLNPKPAHVYVTQYADPTVNDKGVFNTAEQHHCRMLDDVFWPNPLNVVTDAEAELASHLAQTKLNASIRVAVANLATNFSAIDWQLVDGLSVFDVDPDPAVAGKPGLFVGGPDGGPGHGYCASDNWIRRADESEVIQGPVNWRAGSLGTMHPNFSGQQVIKSRILRYMLPDLTGQSQVQPPSFSFSYSSGGLTSQPGLNGWYLRSCDSSNNCQQKVVGQAVATSAITLNGASISVNDTGGCAIDGVSCSATLSTDQKQVTYAVQISATGTYRFQFNAQDANGQAAFLQKEIKVDLEDPVLATPFGPFEVDEGSSVQLSAHIATVQVGDPPQAVPINDDVVVNYDWDLDNDGIFETTDEQPAFSAAELDGPGSHTIQVQVIDRAGRTATAQATVNIINVDPVVAINGVPATSSEGTAISLTSSVTGAGEADTFTYDWVVKKDGSNYASGAATNFSFTPDDNGSYEVSLNVTDDDGGAGSDSQTIAVTNVAPALSNLAGPSTGVGEAASFTLKGDIAEPGSADPLTLTIDWADGSTPELVSLPAGSTSFSRSHTYADDNPTNTASDTYIISLSIADDDGGSGTGSASVLVNNLAPSVTITSPEAGTLYAVNATVNLSASLTDPSSLDTLSCNVNWDDGVTEPGALAAGVCTASHVYKAAGVYTIQMTGTDDDTGTKAESVLAVVYDPSEGFVTGGGWIASPAGAYTPDPSLTGQAGFGFVSKYHKGATVPSGGTEFQFKAGNFYFESEAYDWLVVSGARAQFKGTGAVNGVSGYSFLLTLTDGDVNGGGGVDKFRIKIWDAVGVVYDNMIGSPDDMDGTNPQAIGGGSIVIHSK